MAPADKFENHLFISYAHIDNEHFSDFSKGWVDLLHERIEQRLQQLRGMPVKIWRDRKLGGNDLFNDAIVHELSKTAIFVSVISPRYFQSHSCQAELEDFLRFADQNGGVRVVDKHRVFKVIKTYVPLEEHPPELRELLGYEFYALEQASGRFREFDHEIGPKAEKDKRYWDKFEDLAQDISFLLKRMLTEEIVQPSSSGSTIYLAETTSDLNEARDQIKRELHQYGHMVLPNKALPLNAPALRDVVRDYLAQCRLSVHLIGGYYGIIPEMESERSIVRLQQELAVDRGDNAQFSRLIWMPPGLQPEDDRQKTFISSLQNGFNSPNGSELLQVKLEDLKTIIQTKLAQKPKVVRDTTGNTELSRVYLICDQQDVDATESLQNYLFDRGCEVTLPLLDGNQSEVAEDHKENLILCDAVLIFQGIAGESWLRMKVRELLKLRGYGRTLPLLGKAIYIAAPESVAKVRFKTLEAQVIKNYGAFDPVSLESFVVQISKDKGLSA